MFVRDLRLPDTCIRQVAQIHGVMAIFGDLPLSLAQRTHEVTHLKEQWFDKEYKILCFENKNLDDDAYGAVIWLGRDGETPQSFAFTLKDAENAKLYPPKKRDGSPSPDSPWAKYTKMMLRYKARSIALKSLFADAINGVAIAEYDFDTIDPEIKDVTPKSKVSSINDKLGSEEAS